jgi:dTDP-4-dehydrorhamnose 3,5-epimerase
MRFATTAIPGLVEITLERHEDARGSFARTFCEVEFAAAGLPTRFVQRSCSVNGRAGTLRGMHWQAPPHEEGKLVRCVRGALFDVVADPRPDSPTFRRWQGFELAASGDRMLFIPPGCAHGFLTLAEDTELDYAMTMPFVPGAGRGFRFDDPVFGIAWPRAAPAVIGGKDLDWPPFAATAR